MGIKEITKTLINMDVSEYTQKKGGLTYLSWAHAWREILKAYPEAIYTVKKDENGQCWFGNHNEGFMVYTTVTIENVTREMWLPVMDFRNKTMLEPSTFDINKAVMRCLTKNLAMFGLGIYIYNGEDLPEQVVKERKEKKEKAESKTITNKQALELTSLLEPKGDEYFKKIIEYFGVKDLSEMTVGNYKKLKKKLS